MCSTIYLPNISLKPESFCTQEFILRRAPVQVCFGMEMWVKMKTILQRTFSTVPLCKAHSFITTFCHFTFTLEKRKWNLRNQKPINFWYDIFSMSYGHKVMVILPLIYNIFSRRLYNWMNDTIGKKFKEEEEGITTSKHAKLSLIRFYG